MYPRALEKTLKERLSTMPAVAVLGPRQSGKTTLCRMALKDKPYVSLEHIPTREFAEDDPEAFLDQFPDGVVLDEIQRLPNLFSYLQLRIDSDPRPGRFVLTGSNNFSLNQSVTQTLAGRISLLTLLPFTFQEIAANSEQPIELNDLMHRGFFPRIYDQNLNPQIWLEDYMRTYIEKDVRMIRNIGDLSTFSYFVRLCAGRAGQLINLSELGNDCGINHNTAKAWLSVLEASYIIYRLQPFHKNYNKRIKRSPKLYFYDTGLLCFLLQISKPSDLVAHALRGAIFENYVLAELVKHHLNQGISPLMYFWRDKLNREVDCIIQRDSKAFAIETKSGTTLQNDQFRNLKFWSELTNEPSGNCFLVYAGDKNQIRSIASVWSWDSLDQLLEHSRTSARNKR